MASFLFDCAICKLMKRGMGAEPPGFVRICDDCKPKPAPAGPVLKSAKGGKRA